MLRQCVPQLLNPGPLVGLGGDQRGHQAPIVSISIINRYSRWSWRAAGWSALLTTNTSATSRMPALRSCTESPLPRLEHQDRRIGQLGDLDFGLADTNGLHDDELVAEGVEQGDRIAGRAGEAAEMSRLAIDRMKTPGSVKCSESRMRSPRIAPCENGELGSTETTPTRSPFARALRTKAERSPSISHPGRPGEADGPGSTGARAQRGHEPGSQAGLGQRYSAG